MDGLTLSFSGNPTINIGLTAEQTQAIIAAALEATVTTPLTNIDEALTALQTQVAALAVEEAADRAAFDALATAVRALLANLPAAGGTLTQEQATLAQNILDSLGASAAAEHQEAADEAALQGEIPA